jgi:hypothetical protein
MGRYRKEIVMNELLMDVAKAIAVVTAVLWIPCGVIGIGWCVRWAIRERRWWKAAQREAFDEERDGEPVPYGEEVVYR